MRVVDAVCADRLEKQTGYGSLFEAITTAKRSRDGLAIWYCLEVVKPMVIGMVAQYVRLASQKRLPALMSREDLEQVAFEHIIRSIDRFDPPERSAQDDLECLKAWNRYTNLVVRSPVRDAYAQALGPVTIPDWALKIASRLNRAIREHDIEQSEKCFLDGTGVPTTRAPDPRIIAAKAGVEYSKVKRYIDTGLHFLPSERFTYNAESTAYSEATYEEGVSSELDDPAIQLTEGQDMLLAEGMQLLNSRQRYVISRLYGLDGKCGTYKSVAKALKLDPEDVEALERAAIAQLKAAFMEEDLA